MTPTQIDLTHTRPEKYLGRPEPDPNIIRVMESRPEPNPNNKIVKILIKKH